MQRIQEAIVQFESDITTPYIHKVARFHCEFENIHPFIDGNGRIGRVLNNYFLYRAGFPSIIVRNKEKRTYYDGLRSYDTSGDLKPMIRTFGLAVLESLHKRLSYLDSMRIISLAEHALTETQSLHTLINAALRQTIPAFREKGVWKIGVKYRPKRF